MAIADPIYAAEYRDLLIEESAVAAGAAERITIRGHVYSVVPLVMLRGDIVISPSTSRCPELVPADVLARCRPEQWNQRPVYIDHPIEPDGQENGPESYDSAMGMIQDAYYDLVEAKLRGMLWLDVAQFDRFGLSDFLADIEQGGEFGVSVGTYTRYLVRGGVFGGKPYCRIWEYYIAYHLALLPPGVRGACGLQDGCGTNLTAGVDEGQNNGNEMEVETMALPRFLTRAAPTAAAPAATPAATATATGSETPTAESSVADAEGLSDMQVRSALSTLLYSTEPAFDWILGVYYEDSTLVYRTMPMGGDHLWHRHWTIDSNGTVALADDRTEVTMVPAFVPVSESSTTAAATNVLALSASDLAAWEQHEADRANQSTQSTDQTPAPDCGCRTRGERMPDTAPTTTAATATGSTAANAAPATTTPATPTATTAAPVAAASAPAQPATSTQPTDAAQAWLAAAPDPALRQFVLDGVRAQENERTALLTQLATSQTVYPAERLNAMDLEQLRELSAVITEQARAAAAAPRDYSGRGITTAGSNSNGQPAKKLGAYDRALAKKTATAAPS